MSCKSCELAQESPVSAFYRWKNANVEIRGCDVHLREIFEALSVAQGLQAMLPTQPIVKVKL